MFCKMMDTNHRSLTMPSYKKCARLKYRVNRAKSIVANPLRSVLHLEL